MSATNSIQQLNCELANKPIEKAKQNPSALAGKFVGIANGKVVVVSDDLDELGRQLEQAVGKGEGHSFHSPLSRWG